MDKTVKKYQNEDIEDSSHFGQDDFNSYNKYDRYFDEQIKNMRLSLPWIILTFGLIGNILILLVFSKKLRKRNSNAFCFCMLAISDILALIFMLLRALLKTEILNNLNASCKAIKFLYHFFLQISSWCLVLLTLDRLVAVTFIFKYKTWCKKFHALKVFIGIIILVLILNLHLLIFVNAFEKVPTTTLFEPSNNPAKHRLTSKHRLTTSNSILKTSFTCNVSIENHPIYFKYLYRNWDIFHAIIYGGLPFTLILTANCIIIFKLIKMQKTSSKYLSDDKNNEEDSTIKSYQLTIMLLTVAFTFLVLTTPISIYMAFIYDKITHVRTSKREFIKVMLRYLGYVNNAINFYVYFLTSTEFRREIISLFQSCRNLLSKSGRSSIYTACTTSTSLPEINIEAKPIRKPNTNGMRSKNKYVISKPMEQRVSEFERELLTTNSASKKAEEISDYENKRVNLTRFDRKPYQVEREAFITKIDEENVLVTSV